MYWLDLLIAVVAGIWTLFHIIWNIAGQTSDDYWGPALLSLLLPVLGLPWKPGILSRPQEATAA